MSELAIICQVILAIGIVNVWLVRSGRPTSFRPGGANSMVDEFRAYGLPDWSHRLIGGAKLLLAALLIAGIWLESLVLPAAGGLAVLMLGALAAHARVRDPWFKSVPAMTMLALCVIVAVANGAVSG